jgi:ribosome-associated toxin RatA of RatAB toxin-antitoxin module
MSLRALSLFAALILTLSVTGMAHAQDATANAPAPSPAPAVVPVPAPAISPLDTRAHAMGTEIALANVTHPSHGVEWGRAEGVVEASPADVLAIMHDYAQYAGIFPYFEKSRVLSQRGSDALIYLEAVVLHGAATLWSQVRMSSTSPTPGTQVVEAKMMKGKGNISQLLARWEVTPIDGGQRSFVTFQILVDPDLPFPDSIVSGEMKKGAGQAFRALRKRVAQRVYASRANNAM